ncbi:MAG TPA: hypothetical protein VML55_01035, partial [Planctomycetaceae bacterium]|nr:hypothetical protein [Planctomycetaceae bacterium]
MRLPASKQRLDEAPRGRRGRRSTPSALLLVFQTALFAGCTAEVVPLPPVPVAPALPAAAFYVPANQPWVATGVQVSAGHV